MTFNLLGLASGEGGMAEIMSIGMFACQTIIMYPKVPEEVDFSHEAIKTLALRLTITVLSSTPRPRGSSPPCPISRRSWRSFTASLPSSC